MAPALILSEVFRIHRCLLGCWSRAGRPGGPNLQPFQGLVVSPQAELGPPAQPARPPTDGRASIWRLTRSAGCRPKLGSGEEEIVCCLAPSSSAAACLRPRAHSRLARAG